MSEKKPKVSVCVVTYNQEKYIKDCLESLVTQECNFDFEVIVGEDCSTDNTRAVIQEYVDKYPNIIKPIFHEKNFGASNNFFYTNNIANGKYICHMDGDDYALPNKLQTQVDFMDKTPVCNVCFHRVKVLYPNGEFKDSQLHYNTLKVGYLRDDLMMLSMVGTNSSRMYRKETLSELNKYKHIENMMDFTANIIQIQDKKAMYIDDKFYGVYRANIGIMSNPNFIDITLENMKFLNKLFPDKREYLNTMPIRLFLSDLKNLRKIRLKYFIFWLKTFHYKSIFYIIKYYFSLKYRG